MDPRPSTATSEGAVGSRGRTKPRGAPICVANLPPRMTPGEATQSHARFHAGLRVYTACLPVAVDRGAAVRTDPRFALVPAMPQSLRAEQAARNVAFRVLDPACGFTQWAVMAYASSLCQHGRGSRSVFRKAKLSDAGRTAPCGTGTAGSASPRQVCALRAAFPRIPGKDGCGNMQPILRAGTLVGFQWGGQGFILASPKACAEREEFARIEGVIRAGSCRYSRRIRE